LAPFEPIIERAAEIVDGSRVDPAAQSYTYTGRRRAYAV
jgi:hypothetical protein